MLSNWPIRVKLLAGLALLVLVVAILSSSGLYATYAYRDLVKGLRQRAAELPVAAQLSRNVSDLRITLSELHGLRELHRLRCESFPPGGEDEIRSQVWTVREQFRSQLEQVEQTLTQYRTQLERKRRAESRIRDTERERKTVHKIEAALSRVRQANPDQDWMLDEVRVGRLDAELEKLQLLTAELPSHLHGKLRGFADEVKGQYRTLILGTWITSISAILLFALFMRLSWKWVLHPLRCLIHGSRRVAGGDFDYRIHLRSRDEMAELGDALNHMTARFQEIRDDLDRQVQQRTKQVVRSERLASVGFLAAGVAHEINNPLASIAMGAESLQPRLRELLGRPGGDDPPVARREQGAPSLPEGHAVILHYLQMIQDEAFRCKEITEKLLDFSRMGQAQRHHTDLGELVRGVVEMVGHLGRYQQKQIRFVQRRPVVASVNAQEMKQVVLNLLANALDSTEEDGCVRIELDRRDAFAELTFADNGCGMEPEVLDHVFEPFFTRRRAGQGTGLGLSITYRIVADHGGEIVAQSPGLGQGATFRVTLPLTETSRSKQNPAQAA